MSASSLASLDAADTGIHVPAFQIMMISDDVNQI
jgi:hypothetical protein